MNHHNTSKTGGHLTFLNNLDASQNASEDSKPNSCQVPRFNKFKTCKIFLNLMYIILHMFITPSKCPTPLTLQDEIGEVAMFEKTLLESAYYIASNFSPTWTSSCVIKRESAVEIFLKIRQISCEFYCKPLHSLEVWFNMMQGVRTVPVNFL